MVASEGSHRHETLTPPEPRLAFQYRQLGQCGVNTVAPLLTNVGRSFRLWLPDDRNEDIACLGW